ncbi:MAG: multi-sensor signal transduction histidine kinase [Bacteroidetes bacterium]|nr:multi-sensor signal transduction histidine kinase [Bacteroidota bacterium]
MSDTGAVRGIDILKSLSSHHDPATEQYGMRLLRDAIHADDTLVILQTYIILARYYTNARSNVPKAFEYAHLAEKIAAENKVGPALKAEISLIISNIYKESRQYHRALQNSDEALRQIKELATPNLAEKRQLYEIHLSIAMLQEILGLRKLAARSMDTAMALAKEMNDADAVMRCNLTRAKQYVAQKRHSEALAIYLEVLPDEAMLVSDDNRGVFRDYLAATYTTLGMYEEAEKYGLESLEMRQRGSHPVKKVHPMYELSKVYYKTGKKDKADDLVRQIFELVDLYPEHFTERVQNFLRSDLYAAQGDYKRAHEYWAKIDLTSVDPALLEQTVESMLDTERNKQQIMQEEASMLKSLNEEMQNHARQLKDVNTDLQSYARTASHDLREPLRMISTYMTILSQKINDKLTEDEQKFMHFAVDGAQRMDDMITRILNAAKSQDASLRPVDLNRIAAQAKENLAKLAEEKNAVVTHDPLPMVLGDDIQLLQVIQNIVTNAIKYNQSAQPAIHISFIKDHDKCLLSIADNGVGIAESERENVFKMYQRVENKTGEDGTGIGLYTVKRNIERMKGRIWIEGNEPNGSVFKIELPVAV